MAQASSDEQNQGSIPDRPASPSSSPLIQPQPGPVHLPITGGVVEGIGQSPIQAGVYGGTTGSSQAAIYGTSDTGYGVWGQSNSAQSVGVFGGNLAAGPGVSGTGSPGVTGTSNSSNGVTGTSNSGPGVWGESQTSDGVHAVTHSAGAVGIVAHNLGGGNAGLFEGNVQCNGTHTVNGTHIVNGDAQVTGDVILVNKSGADVAEDFDLEDDPINSNPGTVLVISSNGKLCASGEPYDSRVAGVVSGAGGLGPAVVLQRLEDCRQRSPIALVGKAFCKVDASFGRITAGDMLTTSSTPGHAMKVHDPTRAIGAILGKALGSLENGQGLVPILVTLR